jgi:hypothetical protein
MSAAVYGISHTKSYARRRQALLFTWLVRVGLHAHPLSLFSTLSLGTLWAIFTLQYVLHPRILSLSMYRLDTRALWRNWFLGIDSRAR